MLCLSRIYTVILFRAVKRRTLGFITLLRVDAEYNALYNLTDVAAMSSREEYLLNFVLYYDTI